MPEMNPIPLVAIEEKLGQALTKLECSETPGYSDFEQFVKDLRSMITDGATVWYKNPWTGIRGYIIQHIQLNMLEESEKLGPTITCLKGQHEAETLSISAFQRYILSRIKLQAEEVQSVWLGSAVLIEAELKAMLSQVWKTIRDDDGSDITRVTETEMMGTNAQELRGFFSKSMPELDEYGAELEPVAGVWKTYVREGDTFDAEQEWNRFLDVTLIFAALSTAICTAFVIESSKSLKEDRTETVARRLSLMNGILHAIANFGASSQLIPELGALMSSGPFSPVNLCVNIFWLFTLILSAALSVIVILAKAWCYPFMFGIFGDPWSQMTRRRQYWKRIKKSKMEQVIMILPSLVYLSSLSFAVGLCIYLADMNLGTAIPAALVTLGSILIYLSWTISRFIEWPRSTTKKTPAHELNEDSIDPEARVWKTYMGEADEFDAEQVGGWNRCLYAMLIFAALFTAICTAFVIGSFKLLQADSIETLACQLDRITGSDRSWFDPELRALISSGPFSPVDLCVNMLWFFSLILSAAVSVIVVLSKADPWSQIQRRQQRWEGMEKWRMEQVIIPPSLIYLAFLSFSIGLSINVAMNPALCTGVALEYGNLGVVSYRKKVTV
ncbi:unnamed protein product, partial [Rhizoctonia solani]